MNIRQAILKAADQIESNPHLFNFSKLTIPSGTPGCALGWIGYYLGRENGEAIGCFSNVVGTELEALGVTSQCQFYDRMSALVPLPDTLRGWRDDASLCAKGLRLYADQYHPEQRALIPSSVRAIFDMTPEQLGQELAKV